MIKNINTLIYEKRFSENFDKSRDEIWKEIIKCSLQKYINNTDTVLDIASGRCEFINNIRCKKRIATDFDINVKKFANNDVRVIVGNIMNIHELVKERVDVVFMSNILEHLDSKNDVLVLLARIKRLLFSTGRVIIIHPNYDLARNRYWDHIDHNIALNGESIIEALCVTGYKVEKYVKRYLPLTTISKVPFKNIFVKYYLSLPQSIRPFAGQSFFLAFKDK